MHSYGPQALALSCAKWYASQMVKKLDDNELDDFSILRMSFHGAVMLFKILYIYRIKGRKPTCSFLVF